MARAWPGHVTAAGIRVVEVDRSDRRYRRRTGKSDPLDAACAARAAQSGRASGAPRGRDGAVEAIRELMAAKRTARAQRTQTINQARALILTGPDGIRTRFTRQARQSWSPSWPRCGPARAVWSATTLCYPGASPAAMPSSWTTSSSGLTC
jgi:transposase